MPAMAKLAAAGLPTPPTSETSAIEPFRLYRCSKPKPGIINCQSTHPSSTSVRWGRTSAATADIYLFRNELARYSRTVQVVVHEDSPGSVTARKILALERINAVPHFRGKRPARQICDLRVVQPLVGR